MNYLGHFFLSPPGQEQILLGNFLGDFVKGDIKQHNLPPEVSHGIAIHRAIDSFTDQHELILKAKHLFSNKHRRYSGIILDMCLDHFLARYWSDYNPQPLNIFSTDIYHALNQNLENMPELAKRTAISMQRYNWLCSYSELDNLEVAFTNIGQRLTRDNPMQSAVGELKRLYAALEEMFRQFIKEIANHINTFSFQVLNKSN